MQVSAPPSVAVFAVVYLHWLQAKEVQELSSAALRVWLALLATAAGKPSSNAYLSQISESTGLGETAIRKAFRELENAGLIQRHKGAGWGSPGRRSNGYELLSPPSTRDAEAAAGKALYSKPEQMKPRTQGAGQTPTQGAGQTPTQGAGQTPTQGAGHTRTQGAGTQDLSENLNSGSTHTAAEVDPLLATADRLVREWFEYIKRAPRSPWPSEIKLAHTWIKEEGEHRAFELVRQASDILRSRGSLDKTFSFCGLSSVVVTPYKFIGGSQAIG